MPTYDYKREDGSIFSIQQKMADDALKSCPTTGQKVERIITGGSGVIYKGSGWYVTDYKDKPNPSSSAESTTTDSSSSGTE